MVVEAPVAAAPKPAMSPVVLVVVVLNQASRVIVVGVVRLVA